MAAKSRAGLVIFVVILVGWTFYALISGALGLTKGSYTEATTSADVGKLCEVDIDFAVEAYEVTHTLNILIPTGKEYFYLCTTEDEGIPLLVKAKRSWYNANFDSDGFAYRTVKVTGEVMKMDSKFNKDLADMNRQISSFGFSISTSKYISSTYKTQYGLRLASGAFNIIAVAVGLVLIKKGVGGKIIPVLFIAALLFMGFVMLFGETI